METASLQIGSYFTFIPNLNIYSNCKIVDQNYISVFGLSGYTISGNICSFTVDKS